ncbi:MAG: ATP synthase F1 subunit epsilon [Capsulimonadaceae bacterium]
MSKSYELVVVTPERTVLSDQVVMTIAPGIEGQMGILAHHASLMTELVPGEVRATLVDGRTTSHIAIKGGFMEIAPERTTILADTAERADEIDVTRAEADLVAARAMLVEAAAGTPEALKALQKVQIAETRIRVGRGGR